MVACSGRLEVGRFPCFGVERHEVWYFEDVHLFVLVNWIVRGAGLAYFAITGFRPGLSRKIEVHDDLLLLLHLLLFLYCVMSNAIQSAIVVARVEFLIVKLSSRGSEVLSVVDMREINRSKRTQL